MFGAPENIHLIKIVNRIAASLALPDTDTCLKVLQDLAPSIGMAEICLDIMETYDLPRLIANSPCPLIVTCRPVREGGHFSGSESKRLDILVQAIALGTAYVDIEWDCIDALRLARCSHTQVIVSRHWLNQMPSTSTLRSMYEMLCEKADVVKLVGMASSPQDIIPILSLLQHSSDPIVGLAMGEAGQLTRLLSPCFQQCLLTYGSLTSAAATAPGQLTVHEMINEYRLHTVGSHTAVCIYVCQNIAAVHCVLTKNTDVNSEGTLHVPWSVPPDIAIDLWPDVQICLPHASLNLFPTHDAA